MAVYELKYLKLDFIVTGEDRAPFFIGSALRGSFGHSLKKVCCINPKYACEGCFATPTCLYYDFFEQKNRAHNYRFSIDIPSTSWGFGIYLFGDACERAPYVISAINMALSENGIGKERKKLTIKLIKSGNKIIFDGKSYDFACLTPKNFTPSFRKISKVTLTTPFRLKSDGKRVDSGEITALSVALSAQRRYYELKNQKCEAGRVECARQQSGELKFLDLERYSSRQKTKMGLGGFIGELTVNDSGGELSALLELGEIIGVGKSVVFGLGQIKLEGDKE
ncbi:MAG: CRISPR system precrRNA processing endoribonuclease RAMP protein Cas6 [Campylobacterales bacterium]|nr:CRISPR system precrRNA processing endoribonuclease RAMP protein Cas6 [Campylobacterales bacterium]